MSGEEPPFHGTPPGGRAPDRTWWVTTPDGVRLRAGLWHATSPRGHALLLQGRTEFLEKLSLPAAGLVDRGFSVLSLDWRGQGLSDRLAEPPSKGHVQDFAEYQVDLDTLLASPEAEAMPGPRIMMAHSMGGLIGLAALDRPPCRDTVAATVLSAPLLGLQMPWIMDALAWAGFRIASLIGRTDRWPPFGDVRTTYVLTDPPENILTSDPVMWDWLVDTARTNPQLTLAMPSIAWVGASSREVKRVLGLRPPACPVAFVLGTNEKLVSAMAIRDWSARHGADLIEVEGGRHEVLVETPAKRALAWDGIDGFLNRVELLPRSG